MGRNQVEMFTSPDGPVSGDQPCRRFEVVVAWRFCPALWSRFIRIAGGLNRGLNARSGCLFCSL